MATSTKARKLTLNVSPHIADRLDEMADERNITVTELIRRSIGLENVVDKALKEYGDLSIIRNDTRQTIHHLDYLTT